MLDSYIIDRIRKEREKERRQTSYIPLRIDRTMERPEPPTSTGRKEEENPRGSVIIDFDI